MPKVTENRTVRTGNVSRAAADKLVASAIEEATRIGIEISVAVTDAGGNLKAFQRTDTSGFLTVDIAIDKAWTAASFGLATHVWPSILANPNAAQLAARPRFVAVGGGLPAFEDDLLVGAIGISGGDYLQDQQIAEAALSSLGFTSGRETH